MTTFLDEINKLRTSTIMHEVGVSRQTVATWRKGAAFPAFSRIPDLARLLNLTTPELAAIIAADVEQESDTKRSATISKPRCASRSIPSGETSYE